MIDWTKYFDHIFVISRCINFERRQNIDAQFKKLNIVNYSYWYVPDYDMSNSLIFKKHKVLNDVQARAALGHYTLWKTCYDLNYNNVLIIEDDANFIDDLNEIENQLKLYKENKSDIHMFDGFIACCNNDFIFYLLATCYALNHIGLEYLISMHEKYYLQVDNYFYEFSDEIKKLDKYYALDDVFKLDTLEFNHEFLNINFKKSPINICCQPDK